MELKNGGCPAAGSGKYIGVVAIVVHDVAQVIFLHVVHEGGAVHLQHPVTEKCLITGQRLTEVLRHGDALSGVDRKKLHLDLRGIRVAFYLIQEAVQHTKGGYDVVPANIMLAGAEQELSQTGKEHRLKEAVAPIAADYDFIVIDTPPSLGVLTVNAFTCATDILIPTTAGIFATAGISQLNETVTSVQKYCNPNVKIRGILFTKFNPRANISRQMKELAEQLSEYIAAPIYETYIRSAVVVEEAQANRQDIFDYANRSTVSEDYKAFIEEFLKGVKE